jgi:hypothetical protein
MTESCSGDRSRPDKGAVTGSRRPLPKPARSLAQQSAAVITCRVAHHSRAVYTLAMLPGRLRGVLCAHTAVPVVHDGVRAVSRRLIPRQHHLLRASRDNSPATSRPAARQGAHDGGRLDRVPGQPAIEFRARSDPTRRRRASRLLAQAHPPVVDALALRLSAIGARYATTSSLPLRRVCAMHHGNRAIAGRKG